MAEHRLTPLAPLGHAEPIEERIGPVLIAERTDVAMASVATRRGWETELAARAAQAGLPLPPPGQAAENAPWGSFWLGPEMWMVEAPYATHEDVAAQVKPALGEAASVTEQTDAWVRFEVAGPLKPLFERLCNIDLDRFAPGSATRTLMEHLGVYVIRRAEDRMTVLGPRSSAGSLHHAITVAARSAF
ncbi:sarcosine oxidase subunit gamma [Rubellimicrobium roseum]|uniref:Sarcosine oxidase subunit gamma n=1 Tax=Rubellimicrobium roseum TaxID=687525 RepID=A0A5C4NGI1_9RHOB|nr:sarcosine oxidase subunit gamma [Rubellimicrobium roseum]TNC72156.1 sarcosine oxidase subunit gamma [Rubellimicrobium roseum]